MFLWFVCSVKASLLQGREEQLDDAIEVECTSKAISVMVSEEFLTFQDTLTVNFCEASLYISK